MAPDKGGVQGTDINGCHLALFSPGAGAVGVYIKLMVIIKVEID